LRERACYHTDAQKKTEREGQEHPGDCFRPVTLIWTQSASCQLSVVTPQVGSGTQYIFSQWQDGTTSTTDTVSAPVTSAVYTASFTAGPAGLYSPTQGSTLAGSSATFEWYGPQGTTAFWIDVGSSAGGNNYYQSGSLPTSTVSATVNSLPTSGGQVYVTLYWLLNGSWVSNPYTFTAAGGGSALATLQSPNGGSASARQARLSRGRLQPAPRLTLTGLMSALLLAATMGCRWVAILSTSPCTRRSARVRRFAAGLQRDESRKQSVAG
jgi:hypothetical protein